MPLAFELGEAFQFDWSEKGLVVGGIYYRMQVSHLKLCASRAFWLVAYPSQGHAMLFDARTRSFAAMGGQANTVVRLTVATIFGLVGTSTTGFLSMNLLAAADGPLSQQALAFLAVLALTLSITVYTIVKSKRLSDFLDAVSDERLSAWTKLKSFFAVWRWRQ